MRSLIDTVDFTVEELDSLLKTALDIISNPEKYYDTELNRLYGQSKLKMYDNKIKCLEMQKKALKEAQNYLTTGKNTGSGVVVTAAELNR